MPPPRPIRMGHNALMAIVCQSICYLSTWPYIENGRA